MKVKRRTVREEEGVEGRGGVTREGGKEDQSIISFLSYAESSVCTNMDIPHESRMETVGKSRQVANRSGVGQWTS